MKAHIRWALRRDMEEVLGIERDSFEFPWLHDDFVRCLRQKNCIVMVAECGDVIAGYMVYELHSRRLHLLNFAVDPLCRRLGVGRQMIEKLLGKLSPERRVAITVTVRERNLSAQMFFQRFGFKAEEVLVGYYQDTDEDAYFFRYRIQVSETETSTGRKRGAR